MPNETPTEPTSEERRSFAEGLDEVLREDARYAREAYVLVMEALAFTCQGLQREGHGPMARVTLSEWGIERGEDVGNIVFNLVNHRLLRKTDEDSIQDFAGGYDFYEAFEAPFEP